MQDVRYIYQNFKVLSINGGPIPLFTASVCLIFISFLVRNILKAKQCCPEIKYNCVVFVFYKMIQTNITLNRNFWENYKLLLHTKCFIEEGNLWIFALSSLT